ncbi:hypothetical protein DXA62_12080 [Coprobacillus sp. OF03-2AA]|nr:hypothetical protein DXA62_12080 [Coprobacillus sp. OF03-2AA]
MNFGYGIQVVKAYERSMDMSINCVYMDKNQIILSADSRETFIDESFRDDRQKLFINKKCQIIWAMTGVLKYNNIDYVQVVNSVMNMEEATIEEKLIAIQHIMQYPSIQLNKEEKKDVYFNMFIGTIFNGNFTTYTLEVCNGEIQPNKNKRYTGELDPISSGSLKDFTKYVDKKILKDGSEEEKVKEMTDAIYQAQKVNTYIGGGAYVGILHRDGSIKTFINGEEKEIEK